MALQNDPNRIAADFENWRRQQEAAQAQALEQQRIAEEQQRQQAEAMRQMQEAQAVQQMQAAALNQQNAQPIPALQQSAQPVQQTQPNYAEMAKSIGLPWSPDEADYVQQINDYNARVNGPKQTMAERQATTDALRQQIAANPALLEQGKQNLANDKQLNTLADQLNAFYAKQNNAAQDEAQKAYTTAVLRTQIAQNPELFANAVAQFAPKKSSKKSSKASDKENENVSYGTPYEPPYKTASLGKAGDFRKMDRQLLDEYNSKKKR